MIQETLELSIRSSRTIWTRVGGIRPFPIRTDGNQRKRKGSRESAGDAARRNAIVTSKTNKRHDTTTK